MRWCAKLPAPVRGPDLGASVGLYDYARLWITGSAGGLLLSEKALKLRVRLPRQGQDTSSSPPRDITEKALGPGWGCFEVCYPPLGERIFQGPEGFVRGELTG